jgi:hypothetical protein
MGRAHLFKRIIRREGRPPRSRRRRWLTTLGVVAVMLPVTLGLTGCHGTPPRAIVIVGGHTTDQAQLNGWAQFIAGAMGQPGNTVVGVPLRSQPPWWPGTASNVDSAIDIENTINFMYAASDNRPVDVIAISQGALATRYLLQQNPGNIRSKVASVTSYGGVNAGIPTTVTGDVWGDIFLDWCEDTGALLVCREMVWDPDEVAPGDTAWLTANVNMITRPGDPTPGNIQYYHLYTSNDPGTLEADEAESLHPYGWSVPLLGATNLSAQQACAAVNPDRPAPHGGWWPDGPDPDTNPDPDAVLTELLLDVLHHGASQVSPSVDNPPVTCQDQPGH